MTMITSLNLEPLLEAYCFANTPYYLYKHFRRDESVQQLTKRYAAEHLIDEYHLRTKRLMKPGTSTGFFIKLINFVNPFLGRTSRQAEPGKLEDLLVAYAIAVAATFLTRNDAAEFLRRLDLSRLEWGEAIQYIFLSSVMPEGILRANPKLTQPQPEAFLFAGANSSARIPYRPKVEVRRGQ